MSGAVHSCSLNIRDRLESYQVTAVDQGLDVCVNVGAAEVWSHRHGGKLTDETQMHTRESKPPSQHGTGSRTIIWATVSLTLLLLLLHVRVRQGRENLSEAEVHVIEFLWVTRQEATSGELPDVLWNSLIRSQRNARKWDSMKDSSSDSHLDLDSFSYSNSSTAGEQQEKTSHQKPDSMKDRAAFLLRSSSSPKAEEEDFPPLSAAARLHVLHT